MYVKEVNVLLLLLLLVVVVEESGIISSTSSTLVSFVVEVRCKICMSSDRIVEDT